MNEAAYTNEDFEEACRLHQEAYDAKIAKYNGLPPSMWELAEALADELYNKGYRDAIKQNDQDARACNEWQRVVDAVRREGEFEDYPDD